MHDSRLRRTGCVCACRCRVECSELKAEPTGHRNPSSEFLYRTERESEQQKGTEYDSLTCGLRERAHWQSARNIDPIERAPERPIYDRILLAKMKEERSLETCLETGF